MICNNLQKCIDEQLGVASLDICDNQNRDTCIESSDARSAVKCEEHGKKYVYQNSKNIRQSGYDIFSPKLKSCTSIHKFGEDAASNIQWKY